MVDRINSTANTNEIPKAPGDDLGLSLRDTAIK